MVEVLRLADQLLREQGSTRVVHALLVYLFHVTELEPAQWQALMTSPVSSQMEATMISAAQKLFERGKLEGKLEGESLILLRLLQAKFGKVSPTYQKRIKRADAETLLMWSERVLSATSIGEVFGGSK